MEGNEIVLEKEVLKLAEDAIKKGVIGKEDRDVFLYCLLLLKHGWKRHKEIAKALKAEQKAEEWFKNLKANHYIGKDGKIRLSEGWRDNLGWELLLMMLVAEGYVARCIE